MRVLIGVLLTATLLAGCGADERGGGRTPGEAGSGGAVAQPSFPTAPATPNGPLDPGVAKAVDRLVTSQTQGALDRDALTIVANSRDPRLGWLLSDLLRLVQGSEEERQLVGAFAKLTGADPRRGSSLDGSAWQAVTNDLIAWDLPAPPGYRERKARLFLAIEPKWRPFFADAHSDIDWRLLSWGGVLIDDRRSGDPKPCPRGCIPALDDPALTDAVGGDWYPDDRTVFGVVIGRDAVAFPKNIMEVHEMVNITIGAHRLGIPYCTLCGSAQAYLLDSVPDGVARPVLRTSGLLSRSNKVMYDLRSRSVFDTFTGRALSGPLHRAHVTLDQVTVVGSTWGAWKRDHPGTRIVARDGGIGRSYPLDPLRGRDDNGPIFPIGDVDPRLPVQAKVVGVLAPDGSAIAFPKDAARAQLADGKPVVLDGVEVVADGDGLRVRVQAGKELPAHEAFWFAWSQFHPGTRLWRSTQAG